MGVSLLYHECRGDDTQCQCPGGRYIVVIRDAQAIAECYPVVLKVTSLDLTMTSNALKEEKERAQNYGEEV